MREFVENVIDELRERLDGCDISAVTKDLPNGLQRTGVVIKDKNSNMAPTIYLDDFYKEGESVQNTADKVVEIYNNNKVNDVNMDWFWDFEQVKPNLRARLYNKLTKAEVFKSAEEFGFSDLIIIPYVNVFFNGMEGSIRITKNHLDIWGISEDEIIEIALNNTAKVNNISIMDLAEKIGMSTGTLPSMIVVSTEENNGAYGAIAAIVGKPQLKEMFPDGFYVIPSSIHEVIVLPMNGTPMDVETLTQFVKEVNSTAVLPEEVLSDHVYKVA